MKMAMIVPESYVYKHLFIGLPTLGVQQIMTLLLLFFSTPKLLFYRDGIV
jgi:hypothetical protein